MKKTDLEKQFLQIGAEFQEDVLDDTTVKTIADKLALSRQERSELQTFMTEELAKGDIYPIDEILEQYLRGSDVLELCKLFPGVPTGAFVYFKIKHRWPELRQRFIEDLQYSTRIKAVQTKFNTISFLSTIVNTFIHKNEKGLMKYALSGGKDDSELPARFKISDFNKLSQYMRLIQTAGEINSEPSEKTDETSHPTVHIQTENVTVRNTPDAEDAAQKASDYLKSLYQRSKEEDKK